MARRITINLSPGQRRRFRRIVQRTTDARLKLGYQVVLAYDRGWGCQRIAQALLCSPSTATRVAHRFLDWGELGLMDHRSENGPDKVTEGCYITLAKLVEGSPLDHGWARPTWTQELLAIQLYRNESVAVSTKTISRMLHQLGARRGKPRAIVACRWSKRRREKRVREIQQCVENLPKGEVAFWVDEVDIELNPKIGLDWMLRGQQKTVLTPGVNEKRYVAGALNARDGKVHFVESAHKRSALFIALVLALAKLHSRANKIHLILDNYVIHTSKMVQQALELLEGKVVLHFLPPYDPNDNRIEHLWKELHANVTRNHRCNTIEQLMECVRAFIRKASPFPGSHPSLRRVA